MLQPAVWKQELGANHADPRHDGKPHHRLEPAWVHHHDIVVDECEDRRRGRLRPVIAERGEVERPGPLHDFDPRIALEIAQQCERIRRGAAVVDDDDFVGRIIGPVPQSAHAFGEEIGAVAGRDHDADRRPGELRSPRRTGSAGSTPRQRAPFRRDGGTGPAARARLQREQRVRGCGRWPPGRRGRARREPRRRVPGHLPGRGPGAPHRVRALAGTGSSRA